MHHCCHIASLIDLDQMFTNQSHIVVGMDTIVIITMTSTIVAIKSFIDEEMESVTKE